MNGDARIEAVARAMWDSMADIQDEGKRHPCFHVPISPRPGQPLRHAKAMRWHEAEGAWRTDMLSLAATAVATEWTIDAAE